MNALTLSATRRRKPIVILDRIAIDAQYSTSRARSAACALATAARRYASAAVLGIAFIAAACSFVGAIAGFEDISLAGTVAVLPLAFVSSLLDRKGGEK